LVGQFEEILFKVGVEFEFFPHFYVVVEAHAFLFEFVAQKLQDELHGVEEEIGVADPFGDEVADHLFPGFIAKVLV
jgi:hypothetical protein